MSLILLFYLKYGLDLIISIRTSVLYFTRDNNVWKTFFELTRITAKSKSMGLITRPCWCFKAFAVICQVCKRFLWASICFYKVSFSQFRKILFCHIVLTFQIYIPSHYLFLQRSCTDKKKEMWLTILSHPVSNKCWRKCRIDYEGLIELSSI